MPRCPNCLLALILLLFASRSPAQEQPTPRWVGDFTVLSANAALGGITAGVMQKVRGGSFQDGFTRGALGGVVVYAGKRVAVQRFGGAGLLGREVAAVGTSVVRNAAEGQPSLAELMLPVGPIRLYIRTDSGVSVQPKLDVNTLLWTAYAVVRPELEWDASGSLSAGAPVFRSPGRGIRLRYLEEEHEILGLAVAGAVFLSDVPAFSDQADDTFAHERVHTLQHDFAFGAWGEPFQGLLAHQAVWSRRVNRYLDLNFTEPFFNLLSLAISEHHRRPWEMEANFLDDR